MPHPRGDDRLRLARLARGLSQEDLAHGAGVTRQAISGIEAGRWSPSLEVALSLARVLDTTVEALFGVPGEEARSSGRLAVDRPGGGPAVRVLIGEIAGETVAYPLSGDSSFVPGFVPASGIAHEVVSEGTGAPSGQVELARIAEGRPTLVVAGCDPALALLGGPLGRMKPPLDFAWWPCGNATAMELLDSGAAHAAAVHRGIDGPVEGRRGVVVVGFAAWREGLAVSPRLGGKVSDLGDLVRDGLRVANRDPGSEARRLLDEELARLGIRPSDVNGYATECTAHLLTASAVAAGLADAAVTTEPAALAFDLDFVPWQEEICELHIKETLMGTAEVRGLLEVLGGHELPRQLALLRGYDTRPCGRLTVDS